MLPDNIDPKKEAEYYEGLIAPGSDEDDDLAPKDIEE